MNFSTAADNFSTALSFIAYQQMNKVFVEDYEIDEDAWNQALFDAHQALTELDNMGQASVISACFWSVSNATYFFSPLESFDEHQLMLTPCFDEVVNYKDVAITESEDDDDDIYEHTAQKEFLAKCLELDAVHSNN